MSRIVALREQSLRVRAPQELCFQVVSSAGPVVEERGEHEKLVEFRIDLGNRKLVTLELVHLEPPDRIAYRWVRGPLPMVEESIEVMLLSVDACELRYRGRFQTPHGGIRGLVEGWIIRKMFDRAVGEHLDQARRTAEARAERSHIFPRSQHDG
ncbi:MAG: hypothetical protein WEB06_12935 [Actinomycetota bacterium]